MRRIALTIAGILTASAQIGHAQESYTPVAHEAAHCVQQRESGVCIILDGVDEATGTLDAQLQATRSELAEIRAQLREVHAECAAQATVREDATARRTIQRLTRGKFVSATDQLQAIANADLALAMLAEEIESARALAAMATLNRRESRQVQRALDRASPLLAQGLRQLAAGDQLGAFTAAYQGHRALTHNNPMFAENSTSGESPAFDDD